MTSTTEQETEASKQKSEKSSKANASQKLEALQDLVAKQSNQIGILAEEIDKLAKSLNALGKRVNAIVRSGDEGQQISSRQVNSLLIADAAKELEAKVEFLVNQGVLSLDNSKDIDDNSFVVGRELNSEGEEINPRVQFAVRSLRKEGQDKVLGRKTGDLILGEDGFSMEILQVYSINEQQPSKE